MSRVKMFGAIPRAPHLTPEQFHDHYRHPHGTLGRHISLMKGYVQCHQVHSDHLGSDQTRFEACAEVLIDSPQDAINFGQDPIYLRDVIDDEINFVDMPNLRWIFVREEIIVSGPDLREPISKGDAAWRIDNRPLSFKVLQFIEEDGQTPWDQTDDAALGRRIGALRHVRGRPDPIVHPDGAFAIGVRELWWPTKMAMDRGIAGDPDAWKALIGRPARSTTFAGTAERFI